MSSRVAAAALDASVAQHLLEAAEIRVYRASEAADVHARLADALQSAAFNVVSLAGVIALIHKKDKIGAREIAELRAHFAGGAPQAGGSPTGFPSDYFGVAHASYSPAHAGAGVQAAAIDFAAGVARPAHGPADAAPQSGGAAAAAPMPRALSAAFRRAVAEILAQHELSASKSAEAELVAILQASAAALIAKLRAQPGALTLKKLNAVVAAPEFAAFH